MSMSTSSIESFNQRTSQKRLLNRESSVPYQVDSQPNFPEDNIKKIISQSVAYISEDVETTTSKSFIHGFILVTIMITSLIAFICCKVRRCTNYVDVNYYKDCSKYFHFYSMMTIASCLVTFLIYFLHLIAQCDIMCLTRKKYEYEIITIASIGSLLLISSLCYMAHTDPFLESFTLTSFILSAISVTLYLLRIIILTCEMISQRRKTSMQANRNMPELLKRSISKDQSSLVNAEALPVTKVISYVRNSQRKKTMSTSISEDLEDDVFIQ